MNLPQEITAQQIVDRIKERSGTSWKESPADIFSAGRPDTVVTGIVTSFTPSIDVLQRSVVAGKNLLITQQPAFYGETDEYLKKDPAYIFKKDLIEKNKLVIWRFYDNWNSSERDGQFLGLARALGWDRYRMDKYFILPEGTLQDKMVEIRDKLKIPGIRVIGYPGTRVKKAVLSQGMFSLPALQEILKDPEVNLILVAEAIEWESCEYFRDILTWKGKNMGMILIGREASEDPGYREVASWLKTFIPEVPVEWIPSGEPFWIP